MFCFYCTNFNAFFTILSIFFILPCIILLCIYSPNCINHQVPNNNQNIELIIVNNYNEENEQIEGH